MIQEWLTNHQVQVVFGLATLLGALGMWLMLPRPAARGRVLGVLLALVSLGLFASQLPLLGEWLSQGVFYVLAAVTVIAAAATVTVRNPVYAAIWFALSLLGTAALFLFQGAQFLGVATIVVYAGAILVTFLFVLMLAQPTGHAYYDRLSWESLLSAATGAAMVGILTTTIHEALPVAQWKATHAKLEQLEQQPQPTTDDAKAERENNLKTLVRRRHDLATRLDQFPPPRTSSRQAEVLAAEHMAHLGAQLFSQNLMAVEIAGTLLLVALVGTVAIVAQVRTVSRRSGTQQPGGSQ